MKIFFIIWVIVSVSFNVWSFIQHKKKIKDTFKKLDKK
jgi:hypothetical protein